MYERLDGTEASQLRGPASLPIVVFLDDPRNRR